MGRPTPEAVLSAMCECPSCKGTPSPASLSRLLPHNPHPGFPTFLEAGYDPIPSSQAKKP